MQASIADILNKRGRFAGQVVNIDGILLITDYDRESARFEQVWLVKKPSPRDSAIRARPIRSDSTLWHGLSRLNPRHMAGFLTYRVHDAVRACVRVLDPPRSESDPAIDILTAAIYRREFTLYIGEKGVRLDQALPTGTSIVAVPDIQANIARYLGRRCFVYGTLVVRSSPAAQFLLPGRIPYTRDFRSSLERSSDDEVNDVWLRISSTRRATASRPISTRCRIDSHRPGLRHQGTAFGAAGHQPDHRQAGNCRRQAGRARPRRALRHAQRNRGCLLAECLFWRAGQIAGIGHQAEEFRSRPQGNLGAARSRVGVCKRR